MMGYILGIDQSTQGTKAILVDNKGRLRSRADQSHRQIVNERGWVSHDLEEIYQNTCRVIQDVVERTGISKNEIEVIGISNHSNLGQRRNSFKWSGCMAVLQGQGGNSGLGPLWGSDKK